MLRRLILLTLFYSVVSENYTKLYKSMHKLTAAMTVFQQNYSTIALEMLVNRSLSDVPVIAKTFERINLHLEDINSTVFNPISVFDWLFHMRQMADLLKENGSDAVKPIEKFFNISQNDVNMVSLNILVLQWLYNIPTQELIHGFIESIPPSKISLTKDGIQHISEVARRNYLTIQSVMWLIQVVKHFGSSCSLNTLEQMYDVCLLHNETKLARIVAIGIQKKIGYHHIVRELEKNHSKIEKTDNVDSICWETDNLEQKTDRLPPIIEYNTKDTPLNKDFEMCLSDEDQAESAKPIIRSGPCRWSVPSPFYIIGPLKEERLSEDPEIKLWHDFFHDSEITKMVKHADNNISGDVVHDHRVAETVWINENHDAPFFDKLNNRLASAANLKVIKGDQDVADSYEVVNYGLGGFFNFHHDSWTKPNGIGRRVRQATMIVYLNDDYVGGSTIFPDSRIAVTPKKGMALFFFNLLRNGAVMHDMQHAGCPILAGNKWAVNKCIPYGLQSEARPCLPDRYAI